MEILKIKNTVLQAGRPKVAVPLMSQQPQEIIAECERAALLPCDLIEWRADSYLSGIEDLEEVLQEKDFYLDFLKILDDLEYIAADKPLIFTMRSVQQGGMLQLSQMQKAEIYQLVARSGLAGLIDVELPASAQTADDICEDGGISLREQIDEMAVKSSVPTTSLTGCWLQRKSWAGSTSCRMQEQTCSRSQRWL